MRASNLQDLVYKQGQAGVNKASVTIIFDNSDKSQSPVGYEHNDTIAVNRTVCLASLGLDLYRRPFPHFLTTTCFFFFFFQQVVIGGRNKYMINGNNAQPGRVQNLFHSVQLNVNNPHFLIMQVGRGTGCFVANMSAHLPSPPLPPQGRITKVLNMKPVEVCRSAHAFSSPLSFSPNPPPPPFSDPVDD